MFLSQYNMKFVDKVLFYEDYLMGFEVENDFIIIGN